MIEKLEKFEAFINKMLEKLGALLFAVWLKMIPGPILTGFFKLKVGVSKFGHKVQKAVRDFLAGLRDAKQKRRELKDSGQYVSWQQRAKNKVLDFKELLLKTPLKKKAEFISVKLNNLIERLFAIPRAQFLIAVSAMAMIFFGTYSVYTSSQNIYMKEWGSRAPASVDKYLNRPAYLKFPERTMKVFNVRVPIYVDSDQSVRSVTVDFTVRTDTRFARMFLEEYEYKLKDYFFMTTEPVVASFPLEQEGKTILKEKIQDELNNFLKEERVEGNVLEVDLIFMVGS